MSNKTLRAIYTGLASAHVAMVSTPRRPGHPTTRAALNVIACLVAPLVDLKPTDLIFLSRPATLRRKSQPIVPNGLNRFYAAIGAATALRKPSSSPVVTVFLERHELTGKSWSEALSQAAELPLLLIVLPRWKGRDTPVDLSKLARAAGVPGIPVDAQDPIALYRVAQECHLRARAGGGGALLEAVILPAGQTATEKLATYLLHRRIASQTWIDAQATRELSFRG